MFRITSKVKIAAGLAAGALTLGAAGAYAAQNLPITISSPVVSTLGSGTNQLKVVSLKPSATPLASLPASALKDPGACVSYFAKNHDYALVPQGYTSGSITISKANFHGKLMSDLNEWCKTQLTSGAKTDGAETPEAPDTDSTDSTSQGNGHGKHATR